MDPKTPTLIVLLFASALAAHLNQAAGTAPVAAPTVAADYVADDPDAHVVVDDDGQPFVYEVVVEG